MGEPVKMKCKSCNATTLYSAKREVPGEGVLCHSCGGKGYTEGEIFTGVQPRTDIKLVQIWVNGDLHLIPYADYLASLENK